MLQPTRLISTPFAQEGEKTEIQNVTGEFDNSATYQLGFPPLTMQSIRLGGKPPKGTDFNGILFDITENISFLCKGGRYQYNAGLSTLIGGYPEGSNLLLDDNVTEVVSTINSNQNNPNTDMTGWTFKPNRTTAEYVADASGETQQQVNYNGGSKWHSRVGGYQENERVILANGDIVKSTIDGNTNDPNVDMTGWAYSSLTPSKNLSDVVDKAAARTNLGVMSSSEVATAIANATPTIPNATETVAGKAKIATTAIAQAGVNDTDIITAKKLRDASFGFNQTYTDVTASRSINTVFTNSSPKPIFLAISVGISARTYAYIYCGANEATSEYSYLSSGSSAATLYAIVNPSEEYRLTGALNIAKWRERS